MTFLSDAVTQSTSEKVQAPEFSQRTNAADCSITFFDHVPEADRQQVRDVVAALLVAKQAMMHGGANEPSLLEVAERLGVGRRLDAPR
jgi:hypothetical protein